MKALVLAKKDNGLEINRHSEDMMLDVTPSGSKVITITLDRFTIVTSPFKEMNKGHSLEVVEHYKSQWVCNIMMNLCKCTYQDLTHT